MAKVLVKHRFEAQFFGGEILSGAYKAAAVLEVFEYGEGAQIWLPETVFYYKAVEDDGEENTLLAVLNTPARELVVEREGSGERLPVSTLTFSEAFPASLVFKKFFLRRDQSDYGSYTSRLAKESFYYVRATDRSGNSLVEGVVYVPFRMRYADGAGLGRVQVNGQVVTYHRTEAFQVRLIHPAVELQQTPIIDAKTEQIEYTDSSSTGRGFADFLYRKFSRDFMPAKAAVLQSFAEYLNRYSELAAAGILQVEATFNHQMTFFYGVGQIGFLKRESSVVGGKIKEVYKEHDILEERIWLDEFLLSDDYGWSLTENAKGEKRDWSVERTRGLRDGQGRYGANEPEYSFLKQDSAMALMKRIAESCEVRISFEVANETTGSGTRQYVRVHVRRDFHDGAVYIFTDGNGFQRVGGNVIEIDRNRKDEMGDVVGGDVDTSGKRELEFEPKPILKLKTSEINGSGSKRAEVDGKFVRYDLIHEKNEYDGEDYGVRQAITPKRESVVENLFASSRREAVKMLGVEGLVLELETAIPSGQDISSTMVLKEFLKRKRVGNRSFLRVVPGETISGSVMRFEVEVAPYYFVRLGDKLQVFDFFAQAQLEYRLSRMMSLMRVVIRDAKLIRVDAHRFNEATLLITNVFNEVGNEVMRRYVPLDVRVDEVSHAIEGSFEQVKEPFDRRYPVATDEQLELFVVYDVYSSVPTNHRHALGAVRYRRYTSDINNLMFPTGPLAKENREIGDGLCMFGYASGAGVLGNDYRGVNVYWAIADDASNIVLSVRRVINGKIINAVNFLIPNSHRVSNLADPLFGGYLSYFLSKPMRYQVSIKAMIGGTRYTKATFFDVFSGFARLEAKHGALIHVQAISTEVRAFHFQARFASQGDVLLFYNRWNSSTFGAMRQAVVLSAQGDLYVVLAWGTKMDSRVLRAAQQQKKLGRTPRTLLITATLNGTVFNFATMDINGSIDGEMFTGGVMSSGLISNEYMNQFEAWRTDRNFTIFEVLSGGKCHVDYCRLMNMGASPEPVFDLSFNHVGHFLGTDFWINQPAVPWFFKNKSNADGSLNDNAGYVGLTSVDVTGEVGVVDGRVFGKF